MALAFSKSHNTRAFTDKTYPGSEPFHQPIDYLLETNWRTGMTIDPDICESHIRSFWSTAELMNVDGVQTLRALVQGEQVSITENLIREVLELNDANAPRSYPTSVHRPTFIRMRYGGNLETDNQINKALFSANWKFILHICLHCFSSRKTGWNNISDTLAAAIHGLVTGQGFNMSSYIFQAMVFNLNPVGRSNKFLMYPRFLQACINHLFPALPHPGNILKQTAMDINTLKGLIRVNPNYHGGFTPFFPNMLQLIEAHAAQHQEAGNLQAGAEQVPIAAAEPVQIAEEAAPAQQEPEDSSSDEERTLSIVGSSSSSSSSSSSPSEHRPLKRLRRGPAMSMAAPKPKQSDSDDVTFRPETEEHSDDSPSVSLVREEPLSQGTASPPSTPMEAEDSTNVQVDLLLAFQAAAEPLISPASPASSVAQQMQILSPTEQVSLNAPTDPIEDLVTLDAPTEPLSDPVAHTVALSPHGSAESVGFVSEAHGEDMPENQEIEIVNLQSQNDILTSQLAALQAQISSLHQNYQFQLSQQAAVIANRDREIAQLRAEMQTLKADAPKKGEIGASSSQQPEPQVTPFAVAASSEIELSNVEEDAELQDVDIGNLDSIPDSVASGHLQLIEVSDQGSVRQDPALTAMIEAERTTPFNVGTFSQSTLNISQQMAEGQANLRSVFREAFTRDPSALQLVLYEPKSSDAPTETTPLQANIFEEWYDNTYGATDPSNFIDLDDYECPNSPARAEVKIEEEEEQEDAEKNKDAEKSDSYVMGVSWTDSSEELSDKDVATKDKTTTSSPSIVPETESTADPAPLRSERVQEGPSEPIAQTPVDKGKKKVDVDLDAESNRIENERLRMYEQQLKEAKKRSRAEGFVNELLMRENAVRQAFKEQGFSQAQAESVLGQSSGLASVAEGANLTLDDMVMFLIGYGHPVEEVLHWESSRVRANINRYLSMHEQNMPTPIPEQTDVTMSKYEPISHILAEEEQQEFKQFTPPPEDETESIPPPQTDDQIKAQVESLDLQQLRNLLEHRAIDPKSYIKKKLVGLRKYVLDLLTAERNKLIKLIAERELNRKIALKEQLQPGVFDLFKKQIPEPSAMLKATAALMAKMPAPVGDLNVHILGWKWDNEWKIYMIKRNSGITMFFADFLSMLDLPYWELEQLAYKDIVGVNYNEGRAAQDFIRKTFRLAKASRDHKAERKKAAKRSIPKTLAQMAFPNVMGKRLFKRKIRGSDATNPFKFMYYDGKTHELVIERENEETIRLFCAMELRLMPADYLKKMYYERLVSVPENLKDFEKMDANYFVAFLRWWTEASFDKNLIRRESLETAYRWYVGDRGVVYILRRGLPTLELWEYADLMKFDRKDLLILYRMTLEIHDNRFFNTANLFWKYLLVRLGIIPQ